jgi:hypothetical protein
MLDWILSDTDNIGLVVTLIAWGAYGIAAWRRRRTCPPA